MKRSFRFWFFYFYVYNVVVFLRNDWFVKELFLCYECFWCLRFGRCYLVCVFVPRRRE